MLYWLLYEKLFPFFHPFRIFRYLTIRTAFATLTALLIALFIGPWVIEKLREFQIGQYVREDGPQSHLKKPSRQARHHRERRSAEDGNSVRIVACSVEVWPAAESGERFRYDRRVLRFEHRSSIFDPPGAHGSGIANGPPRSARGTRERKPDFPHATPVFLTIASGDQGTAVYMKRPIRANAAGLSIHQRRSLSSAHPRRLPFSLTAGRGNFFA